MPVRLTTAKTAPRSLIAISDFLSITFGITPCALLVILALAGCGSESPSDAGDAATLSAWAHAGRQAERETLAAQVARFNQTNSDIRIDLTFIPEGAYNSQVQAAALAGDLPDLLEFDGPFLYNYVWQNQLRPIRGLISPETYDSLIPSMIEQGTYNGDFWSVGQFDSGLGLFADRSKLEAVGARIPTHPSEAWTVEEFEEILAKLAERDPDGQVLDLKLNYRGEWYTYAFSPALVSAGGGLIARPEYGTAEGVLDGPESIGVMSRFQRWVEEAHFVDPNVDDNAFAGGRVALSWVGHWEYDRYRETLGDNLVLLPLPDFGGGSRTGQGSWSWGVTRTCPHPEAAGAFLDFLLRDRQVLEMVAANGAVPATRGAIEQSDHYAEGKPLNLYVAQLTGGFAVPRPRTPAYPVITTVFQGTFNDILDGADPRRALERAAREITRDIADNRGYPDVEAER
ncbi:MAG: extracellular solute-binding protein [Kiritimatiellia bacterium]